MRKVILSILSLFITVSGIAKTVTIGQARIVADIYFSHYTEKDNLLLNNSFSVQFNGITVYHVFNYTEGGFVVVAADDAVIPVLAQSNVGYIDQNITSPNVKYWFDCYSEEIGQIIASKPDNTETLKRWNSIRNNEFYRSTSDIGPLLTTTWDQGEWYNYYCPADAGGPGGHVVVGCVATAMAQIMKYFNFPDQGVLSHSYLHPIYGTLSADFGNATYNWPYMGNSANSSNYTDISLLSYHAGISLDMNYGPNASSAFSEKVPNALTTYFNYDPSSIAIAYKTNYTETEWNELLKAELNSSRPIYYGGTHGTQFSHAWVCDGWRSGDNMFHMNWGWSGFCNGWYAIGALNPDFNSFNNYNVIVKGIKPGNPDLIVRITNIEPGQVIGYGPLVEIDCSVIKGSPIAVNLYMDNELLFSSSQASFTYNLITTDYFNGIHFLKVEALNATDTVYSEVKVGNCEWISQASAFTHKSRGIQYIHAVDSLIAWAIAYDGEIPEKVIQEFTRTGNGGKTWKPGTIPNCYGLAPAMVFALSIDTAFCPMYRHSGKGSQGIYMTSCGGSYWSVQTDAIFTDPASFPNVVHFFNHNDGFCMGDPVNGEYEIYTTSNSGANWTKVSATDIPDPVLEEYGVIGYYSAFGDKAWFGTSKGRVYRTGDRGHHWEVSNTSLEGRYIDVEFADEFHGLAQDKDLNSAGTFSETFDGGVTWNTVISTGNIGTTDFCFVPGTGNMWVSTDVSRPDGVFYSLDGGHSWANMALGEPAQYLAVDFINDSCGWVGGFNESATEGGMYRFGSRPNGSVLSPVSNLYALTAGSYVSLTWNAPTFGNIVGYNVYRNDTLLNVSPFPNPFYIDVPVHNGLQEYCITVVYDEGESRSVCIEVNITYGISENETLIKVYPNPATEVINIETTTNFNQVQILTLLGQEVYNYSASGNKLKILTNGFKPGMYVLKITSGNNCSTYKISIR